MLMIAMSCVSFGLKCFNGEKCIKKIKWFPSSIQGWESDELIEWMIGNSFFKRYCNIVLH